MSEPIQRAGAWWHKSDDGAWYRWDQGTETWVPSVSAPPPPPPPPAAVSLPKSPELEFTSFLEVGTTSHPAPRANRTLVGPPQRSKRSFTPPWADHRISVAVAALAILIASVAGYFVVGNLLTDEPAAAAAVTNPLNGGAEGQVDPKQRFISDADAICADMIRETANMPPPTTVAEVQAGATKLKAVIGGTLDRLDALNPPKKDRKTWHRRLKALRATMVQVDVLIGAALRGDLAGVQAAEGRIAKADSAFNRWATGYGFKVCNQKA